MARGGTGGILDKEWYQWKLDPLVKLWNMDVSLYQLVGKSLGKPVKTHVLINVDLDPFSSLLSISHDSNSYPDGCQGQKG